MGTEHLVTRVQQYNAQVLLVQNASLAREKIRRVLRVGDDYPLFQGQGYKPAAQLQSRQQLADLGLSESFFRA